jgi:4-amino-4-deoxy-L-arabinose transferase-like glycosyltransferase
VLEAKVRGDLDVRLTISTQQAVRKRAPTGWAPAEMGGGWLERYSSWLPLALFVLATLARVIHFISISSTAFVHFHELFPNSDMYANWQWARSILAGDLLGRDTFHPYNSWMKPIGTLEEWYTWWGGKEIFQHGPVYPYLVAFLMLILGGSVSGLLCVQLILGGAIAPVVYYLGRRTFSPTVALVAGMAVALYGPLIFYQGVLLRDAVIPLLDSLLLLAILRAHEIEHPRGWILAGLLAGLSLMTKTTVLLFLPFLFGWILWAYRRDVISGLRAGALLAFGLLLCLSPLLVRNALVGAPVLSIDNRAVETLIVGNAPGADPAGFHVPPSMRTLLEASQASVWGATREILRSYEGGYERLLVNLLRKLRALAGPFEIPNNVSYDYGREISPLLRFTLGYGLLLPAALLGIVLVRPRRPPQFLLLLYGAAVVAGVLATLVVARYRLPVIPVLAIFAGVFISRLIAFARQGRNKLLIASLVSFGGLAYVIHAWVPVSVTDRAVKVGDYTEAAKYYMSRGEWNNAFEETRRLIRRLERFEWGRNGLPALHSQAAYFLIKLGRIDEARSELAMALRIEPGDPDANYRMGMLLWSSGAPGEGRIYLERFLQATPTGGRADSVRALLAGSPK